MVSLHVTITFGQSWKPSLSLLIYHPIVLRELFDCSSYQARPPPQKTKAVAELSTTTAIRELICPSMANKTKPTHHPNHTTAYILYATCDTRQPVRQSHGPNPARLCRGCLTATLPRAYCLSGLPCAFGLMAFPASFLLRRNAVATTQAQPPD